MIKLRTKSGIDFTLTKFDDNKLMQEINDVMEKSQILRIHLEGEQELMIHADSIEYVVRCVK